MCINKISLARVSNLLSALIPVYVACGTQEWANRVVRVTLLSNSFFRRNVRGKCHARVPLLCARFAKNFPDPECAIVPRFSTSSASVMPMPVSTSVNVFLLSDTEILISKGSSGSMTSLPVA